MSAHLTKKTLNIDRDTFKQLSRKWAHLAVEKEAKRGKGYPINAKTEKAIVRFVDELVARYGEKKKNISEE
jgi:hypothetical protein